VHAIPAVDSLLPDTDDLELNAYAVDFLRHGQVDALAKGNGIRKGDSWLLLQVRLAPLRRMTYLRLEQDFSRTLATLKAGTFELLMNTVESTSDNHEREVPENWEEHLEQDGKRPRDVGARDWQLYRAFGACSWRPSGMPS
jgi:hypothetical protein